MADLLKSICGDRHMTIRIALRLLAANPRPVAGRGRIGQAADEAAGAMASRRRATHSGGHGRSASMTVRKRLQNGERAYGTMAFDFFTPALTAVLARTGYDFVILDTEHSGVGIETVKQQVAYARGLPIEIWARPSHKSYAAVATMLDAGITGIMAPMLETPEQARELVQWARYRPEGRRGLAFGMPHDGYWAGDAVATMAAENEKLVLIALIETRKGIENAEAILATPGIDIGWVGHWDLSDDIGCVGRMDDPRMVKAFEALATAARNTGKAAAAMDGSLDYVRAQAERGYRVLGWGNDVAAMRKAFGEGLAGLKAL
jgi:2-keto-3-deoxy-L-rhamnonate aldolase RhmA